MWYFLKRKHNQMNSYVYVRFNEGVKNISYCKINADNKISALEKIEHFEHDNSTWILLNETDLSIFNNSLTMMIKNNE